MQNLKASPYELVYEKEVFLPISMEILALQLLKSLEVKEDNKMEVRLVELLSLEEKIEKEFDAMIKCQQMVKWWLNKKASNPCFREGSLVLKFDEWVVKLGQHAIFDSLWKGPFHIHKYKESNAYELEEMNNFFWIYQ